MKFSFFNVVKLFVHFVSICLKDLKNGHWLTLKSLFNPTRQKQKRYCPYYFMVVHKEAKIQIRHLLSLSNPCLSIFLMKNYLVILAGLVKLQYFVEKLIYHVDHGCFIMFYVA